ncbi:MAG: hypothetical protein IPH20_20855 [Bacteroidales bacterium]|nr:hypothetical protein [Bacteroidales bacterium]
MIYPTCPAATSLLTLKIPGRLYVANDIGVYYSADAGNTWTYASEGMPFVPAMDFDYVKIDTVRYQGLEHTAAPSTKQN